MRVHWYMHESTEKDPVYVLDTESVILPVAGDAVVLETREGRSYGVCEVQSVVHLVHGYLKEKDAAFHEARVIVKRTTNITGRLKVKETASR